MNKVKYYRLISGLLLKDLSEKTGLSVGHLSHIENGNKQPSKSAMEERKIVQKQVLQEFMQILVSLFKKKQFVISCIQEGGLLEEKEEMEHLGDEVDNG
mgnify:CR=1 FL=1